MALPVLTRQEVALHNKPGDLWVIVGNRVIDVSHFQEEHPGGPQVFASHGGRDATQVFRDINHSPDARERLKTLSVGVLRSEEKCLLS